MWDGSLVVTFAILLCCGFGLTVYLSCMVVLLARIKRYGEWFLCACFGGRKGDLELEKVWTVLKWLQRLHAYLVSWSWGGVLVGLMIFFFLDLIVWDGFMCIVHSSFLFLGSIGIGAPYILPVYLGSTHLFC